MANLPAGPFDFSDRASNAVVGGAAASSAVGVPPPGGLQLPKSRISVPNTPPPTSIPQTDPLESAPAAPAAAEPPMVGVNFQTGQFIAPGMSQPLDINNGSHLLAAQQSGALDKSFDVSQMPAGFKPVASDQLKAKLASMQQGRGFMSNVGEIAGQGAAGLFLDTPKTVLGALQGPSQIGPLQDLSDAIPNADPDTVGRGAIVNTLASGARDAAGMIPAMGIDAAGAALAPFTSGASVPGALAVNAALYGSNQAHETYGKLLADGVDPDQARTAAFGTGAVTGAVTALTAGAGRRLLQAPGIAGSTAEEMAASATNPAWKAALAKNLAKEQAINVPAFAGQSAANAAIENNAGGTQQDVGDAATHSAITALAMAPFLAPIGAYAHYMDAGVRAHLNDVLTSPDTSPEHKLAALTVIKDKIAPHAGQAETDQWFAQASQPIRAEMAKQAFAPSELLALPNPGENAYGGESPGGLNLGGNAPPMNPLPHELMQQGSMSDADQRAASLYAERDEFEKQQLGNQGQRTPIFAAPETSGAGAAPVGLEQPESQIGRLVAIIRNANMAANNGRIIDPNSQEGLDTAVAHRELPKLIGQQAYDAFNRALPDHTVDTDASDANTSPSEKQKASGNYEKGHTTIAGFDTAIENPHGSVRSGTDAAGTPWESTLNGHYGYLKGTTGNDGDHVDVFIRPGTAKKYAGKVYVIDQKHPDGTFDEHKVMMGYGSQDDALAGYHSNYPAGHDGVLHVTAMTMPKFKEWIKTGDHTKTAQSWAAEPKSGKGKVLKALDEALTAGKISEGDHTDIVNGLTQSGKPQVAMKRLGKLVDIHDAEQSVPPEQRALLDGMNKTERAAVIRTLGLGDAERKTSEAEIAKDLKVTRQSVHVAIKSGQEKLAANIKRAGLSDDQAREILAPHTVKDEAAPEIVQPDSSPVTTVTSSDDLSDKGQAAGAAQEGLHVGSGEGGRNTGANVLDSQTATERIVKNLESGKITAAEARQQLEEEAAKLKDARVTNADLKHPENAADDMAAEAWNSMKGGGDPGHEDLSPAAQAQWEKAVGYYNKSGDEKALDRAFINIADEHTGGDDLPYSKGGKPAEPTTTGDISRTIKNKFFNAEQLNKKVTIVNKIESLTDRFPGIDPRAKAFVKDGRVYMIAENIAKGDEMAVLMHEVGGHLGLERILSKSDISDLAATIKSWSEQDDGTLRSKVAAAAMARAREGGGNLEHESIAYFIEEAIKHGVEPAATAGHGPVGAMLRKLWAAFKAALYKFGLGRADSLTPQDIVDMAYGAAHLDTSDIEASAPAGEVQYSKIADGAVAKTIASLPESQRDTATKAVEFMKGIGEKWMGAAFMGDLAEVGKKYVPALMDFYDHKKAQGATAYRIEEKVNDFARLAGGLTKVEYKSATDLIDKMDASKKWAFDPKRGYPVSIDQELATRFNRLSAKQKSVVEAAFKLTHDIMQEQKGALLERAKATRDEAIAAAEGKSALVDKAERAFTDASKEISDDFPEREGPYAPQQRRGDWLVVAKSKVYREAEKAYEASPTKTNTDVIGSLRRDSKHYFVAARDRGDAVILANQLAKHPDFAGGVSEAFPKEKFFRGNEAPYAQVEKLKEMLRHESSKDLDPKVRNAAMASLDELYLKTLSDLSSRHSAQRREGIAGYDEDRIASIVDHSRSAGHLVALLTHSADVHKAIGDIRAQAHSGEVTNPDGTKTALPGDKAIRKTYANEVMLRHALTMIHVDNKLQNKLLQFTAGMKVVTSPGFYLQQLTEPFMVMLPVLAGNHGYTKALAEMWRSNREAAKIVKIFSGNEPFTADKYVGTGSPAETARIKDMLHYMLQRGRIDLGQLSDLGNQDMHAVSKAMQKTFGRFNRVATNMEAVNRLTSSITAYRLEYARKLQGGMNDADAHAAAMTSTDQLVRITHGEYDAFSAPRYMMQQNWPGLPIKLMTQFKKFQVMQISLMARLIHQSFDGASPTERALGRKMLGFTFAQYAVMTGLTGLPAYGAASTLLDWLLKDKDTPLDPDLHTRQFLTKHMGAGLANLIMTGAPGAAGVPLTPRIGAGGMATVVPVQNVDITDRSHLAEMALSMMGPFVGLVANDFAGAYGKMREGDYYKATEQMMPTALRSAMKTYRMNTQGMTNAQNDVLLAPGNMSFLDKNLQLLGFDTTTLDTRQMIEESKYNMQDYYDTHLQRLAHEYASSVRSGNTASLQDIRDEWGQYQAGQKDAGLLPTPISQLFRSPVQQVKREIMTANGVQFSRQNRGFIQNPLSE